MKSFYKYILFAVIAFVLYKVFTMDKFSMGDVQISLYVVIGLIVGVTILGFMFSSGNQRASMLVSAS